MSLGWPTSANIEQASRGLGDSHTPRTIYKKQQTTGREHRRPTGDGNIPQTQSLLGKEEDPIPEIMRQELREAYPGTCTNRFSSYM
ncbi:hypothetical protein Y1Q_0014071 [Alligator mississippiensis]|uniref:Uncharacterized protein n=1 Tax=Alligator mississippiensis TaxID=8496 RepID=A0A151MJR9_ALLMI|nr:hypothetical protein Y1Q_0014071 [Alligator mississippiensis]